MDSFVDCRPHAATAHPCFPPVHEQLVQHTDPVRHLLGDCRHRRGDKPVDQAKIPADTVPGLDDGRLWTDDSCLPALAFARLPALQHAAKRLPAGDLLVRGCLDLAQNDP